MFTLLVEVKEREKENLTYLNLNLPIINIE